MSSWKVESVLLWVTTYTYMYMQKYICLVLVLAQSSVHRTFVINLTTALVPGPPHDGLISLPHTFKAQGRPGSKVIFSKYSWLLSDCILVHVYSYLLTGYQQILARSRRFGYRLCVGESISTDIWSSRNTTDSRSTSPTTVQLCTLYICWFGCTGWSHVCHGKQCVDCVCCTWSDGSRCLIWSFGNPRISRRDGYRDGWH